MRYYEEFLDDDVLLTSARGRAYVGLQRSKSCVVR